MKTRTSWWRRTLVIAGMAALAACGSDGGGSPTQPGGGGGSGPGPSGATITIGANGTISPMQVTVSVGQSVTLTNSDSRAHEIASDPHPTHGNCPAINALGSTAAGQTKLTNAFTTAGTCGYHDHNDPSNASLQGTITVR
jgi:plastocyanin